MNKTGRKSVLISVILLTFFSFVGNNMHAQDADTLLFRDNIGGKEKKGKKDICSFGMLSHVGFILPPKDNTYYRMNYGNSLQGMYGLQFKMRLANCYRMGFDLLVSGNRFSIEQDEEKWFVDKKQNKKEYFRDGELSLAFTHQFKLNKGIKKSWAIDVSVYGAYVYSASHKTINKDYNPDNVYSGKTRTVVVERNLPYVERWIWGLRAGLTYRGFGIYAQYRMNNLVNFDKTGHSAGLSDAFDMPKFSLGITLSGDKLK